METSSVSMSTDGSRRTQIRLLDLPLMGVRIEAEVTDHHLTLVGNMGSHPGDKLQIRPQREPTLPLDPINISRSRASTGRSMYFPTRSASLLVWARTRLKYMNFLCLWGTYFVTSTRAAI